MSILSKNKTFKVDNFVFQAGQIFKMNVAARSHVNHPYYVEIIEVGENYIVTNIPGEHSLKITKEGTNPNWSYHIPRMVYVGDKKDYGHLIRGQELV